MAMRTNILIITLNINNFIAPIKRLWMNEWIQKQDSYIYAIYKRLTSDWKWGDGKSNPMQMEVKRKLEWQYTY